jgi:hypothetical protein
MLKKKYIAALALILMAGCKKAPVNVGYKRFWYRAIPICVILAFTDST